MLGRLPVLARRSASCLRATLSCSGSGIAGSMLSLVLTALLNVLACGKATPGAMAREQAMNAQRVKKPGFMMVFSLSMSALIDDHLPAPPSVRSFMT